MAKFNNKVTSTKTTNHEGEVAYTMSSEMELYSLVVTSMLSNKFYESSDQRLERLRNLIQKVDIDFVLKLAIYAREQMYLRSIPLVLVVEAAKIHKGDSRIRKTLYRVIKRPDEITETLAYYQLSNNRSGTKKLGRMSKGIQSGLGDAFNKFDEYQFAKYNRKGEINLRDALFLTHPKAKDREQLELFSKIATDTLETPYTWETQISEKGNDPKVWEELVDSGRFPYMAMLRNLRNMLEAGVKRGTISEITNTLSDPEQVRKSKQLPFRFLSAYTELQNVSSPSTSAILTALESAIQTSIENVKGFDEDTNVGVICDVSGSMSSPLSPRSSVMQYDVGLLLGMLLQNKCKSVLTGIFGERYKTINVPQRSILQNVIDLRSRMGEVGYSTNGYLAIEHLRENNIELDKVMIFTDCQLWDSNSIFGGDRHIQGEWQKYKKQYPNAKLYIFDLAGYGHSPVSTHQGDVYTIAGWSDKVFDVLDAYDNGSSAVEHVKKIEI